MPDLLCECAIELAEDCERNTNRTEKDIHETMVATRTREARVADDQDADQLADMQHQLLLALADHSLAHDDNENGRLRAENERLVIKLAMAEGREDALNAVIDRHIMSRN